MKPLPKLVSGFFSGICALALAGNLSAEPSKESASLGLSIGPYFEVGKSDSSLSQPLSDDWKTAIADPERPAKLKSRGDYFTAVGLRIEPRYIREDFQIGLPIFASQDLLAGNLNSPSAGKSERILAETTEDWDETGAYGSFGEEVYVSDIALKRKSPSMGLFLRKGFIAIQYAMQKYEIYRRNYASREYLDEADASQIVGAEKIDSGISNRFDLNLYLRNQDNSSFLSGIKLGIFYERFGKDSSCAGVCIGSDFDLFR